MRLLPADVRGHLEPEGTRDFDRSLEAARTRGGAWAASMVALASLADAALAIPREWSRALLFRPHSTSRTRYREDREIMSTWFQQLRLAARALLRRPGYAAAAVATLGLGIGANVAIFTVVDAVVLRPLPFEDSDAIVTVRHHAPGLGLPELENSPGMLRFYRANADFIGAPVGFTWYPGNLLGGERPERLEVVRAGSGLFDLLGLRPTLGRTFVADDAAPGAPPVVVLSNDTWVARFGADPGVVGRTVELDGVATEVVGVLERGPTFPNPESALYVPMPEDPNGPFGAFGTRMIARLAPDVSVEDAARRATELQARLPDFFPDMTAQFFEQAGWNVTVARWKDRVVGPTITSALWIVLGTVGVLLLIACANVANLFLVRAESRHKELAIRTAMGAGRGRLAIEFLAEAAVLGAAGGVLGVLLAAGGVSLLTHFGPETLPRLHEVRLDAAGLAVAALLSLTAGLALGAIPLLRRSPDALASSLRDGARGSTEGRERHRTRNTLVATQLALALMLLVGSGLMLRSFGELRSIDPGFDGHDVLTVGLSIGQNVPRGDATQFYQRVAEEVASLPGVEGTGLTNSIPLTGNGFNGGSFYVDGQTREEDALPPVAFYKAVGGTYFDVLRQRVVEGRAIEPLDARSGDAVLVVNRTFADRFLEGRALGQGVKWDSANAYARVVGVVEDVLEFGLQEEPPPIAYLPMQVGDWSYPELPGMTLFVRGTPGVAPSVRAIREIVARLDPDVPLTTVRTMDEVAAEEMAETSFTMVILGVAAGIALFLGAVGLFGVISYVVGQRTREIGVRVALGAGEHQIRAMVLRQSVVVVAVGVVLGLLGAGALTRLMDAVLVVSATDPVAFVAAPAVLVAVALLAAWLPARRASRVDPMVALRSE